MVPKHFKHLLGGGSMRLLAILAAAFILLPGCLGDDDAGSDDAANDSDNEGDPDTEISEPEPVTWTLSATGAYPVNPALSPSTLRVVTGAVINATFTNDDANLLVNHNWVIDEINGAQSETIAPGDSTTFSFTAPTEPGQYTYYCNIGDHRDRGMVGTLTVE